MHRFVWLFALCLLASCGKDEPRTPPPDLNNRLAAFFSICQEGGGKAPQAPDYAEHDDHRAIAFEGKGDTMPMAMERLPEDWTVSLPFGEGIDDVDVVVCGERVAAKAVRLCDDAAGLKKAIKWHTATYSYRAYSARTGKPLGKAKTIKARTLRCPTNVSVGPEYAPLDQFALVSKANLQTFVEPYVND